MHVPTGADTYTTSDTVECNKLDRPFFKALGKISKATWWHALNETENSPDPLPTDDKSSRRLASVGYGGGTSTLVSAEAKEEAERECWNLCPINNELGH